MSILQWEKDHMLPGKKDIGNKWVFGLYWLVTFALYFPAAKAGMVIDASGYIYQMQHQSLWNFLDTAQSATASLYHFYMLQFYVLYQLFGLHIWLWSLVYISLHATCAYLLYLVCSKVFADSRIEQGRNIALAGALLFAVCPHVSEVVNWKACHHYMTTFISLLLITRWAQLYQHRQAHHYCLLSLVVFLLAIFSLEVFYIMPFFVLALALYYRLALGFDRKILVKTIAYFTVPQMVLFASYFALLYAKYRFFSPHMDNTFRQSVADYLCKPPKYLFHIVELGRFYPMAVKEKLYAAMHTTAFLTVFYGLLAALGVYILARFRSFSNYGKACVLMLAFIVLTIGILISSPFPGATLLVFYDRYTYFADGFIYTLLVMLVYRLWNWRATVATFTMYALINVFFTIRLNLYWKHSAYITNRLLHELPDPGNRTVLLLNIPENMNGVAMIGAQPDGQYKAMRNLLTTDTIANTVYDVVSYNMTTPHDGAHVQVLNDSTIRVTLNQWGTWWWYGGHGASSYENEVYKVNMVDLGRWYDLTLKQPASGLLLLFNNADRWHTVDMRKQGTEQW